jgi:hypothetical protein
MKIIEKYNREISYLFIISLLYFLSAIFVQPINFTLSSGHPVNDEFYYALPIVALLEQKKFIVAEGYAAWALPQTFIGYGVSKLFGFSFNNMRYINIFFCLLNGLLLYVVFRKYLKINYIISSYVLLLFLFFPPIFINSVTFQSDTIFLFFLITSILFLYIYQKEKKYLYLFLFNLFSLLCIAQRQLGVVLCAYMIFILILNFKKKKFLVFSIIFQATVFFIIYKVWREIIGETNPFKVFDLSIYKLIKINFNIIQIIAYAGMVVAPLIFFYVFEKNFVNKIKRHNVILAIIFLFVVFFIFLKFKMLMPYFDNQYSKFGVFRLNEILRGKREYFFSEFFYIALTFVSSIGSCILYFCLYEKWKLIFKNNLLSVYIVIIVLFTAVSLLLFIHFNDRYLIPFFFIIFLLLGFIIEKKIILKKFHFITIFLCTLFLLFNISVSIFITQDMFIWSEKRWSLAEAFIKKKYISSFELDGGHEWNWIYHLELIKDKNDNGHVSNAEIDQKKDQKYRIVFGSDDHGLHKIKFESHFRRGEISVIKIK